MARLSVVAQELNNIDPSDRPVVDDILFEVPRQDKRKRSHSKVDNAHLRRHLEDEFLRPSTTFSPEWLNRFQQYDLVLFPLWPTPEPRSLENVLTPSCVLGVGKAPSNTPSSSVSRRPRQEP